MSNSNDVVVSVADNNWLKALERIAIPLIIALIWFQWQSLDSLRLSLPSIEVRLQVLEKASEAITERASEARKERLEHQQNILLKIADLTTGLAAVTKSNESVKVDITSLLNKLLEQQKLSIEQQQIQNEIMKQLKPKQ